jgi:hypothetical protein
MKKSIKNETLRLTIANNGNVLEHDTDVHNKMMELQISGYLQYLDPQYIAIKPVCRILGWDYTDVIKYLREQKDDTPLHQLFPSGNWIYQSTWGVHWVSLVSWLRRELKNLDNHDKTYACLLALQILKNAGYSAADGATHNKVLIRTALLASKSTSMAADVCHYLAENFAQVFDAVERELMEEREYA